TAITYGALSSNLGNFREVNKPGAFAAHLATQPDVKFLFNHSPDHILGRTKNGTLKIIDTTTALKFENQLDANNSQHRDLFQSIRRGDIDSMSFAFNIDD